MRRLFLRLLALGLAMVVGTQLAMATWALVRPRALEQTRADLTEARLDWVAQRIGPLPPAQREQEVRELGHLMHLHLEWRPGAPDAGVASRQLGDGSFVQADVPLRPPFPWGLVLASLLQTAVLLLGAWWLTRPVVRDLERLETASRALAAGDLTVRSGIVEPGPVEELGRTFDTMASRVEGLVANQRNLLHAVSHEVRTPLARLRFRIDSLPDGVDVAALDGDLQAIDRLLQELLDYQALEQRPNEAPCDDPGAVVAAVVERMRVLGGATVELEVAPGTTIVMGQDALVRVLENLLSNAQRHARSRVRVSLRARHLSVEDDGPGIPESERERVFEPFVTGDPSRSRQLGGVGLGLAIAQRTAQRWGGRLVVGSSELGGARFDLDFEA